MGMFDYVRVSSDIPCEYCGTLLHRFQTKDSDRTMSNVGIWEVTDRMYTSCGSCDTFHEFIRQTDKWIVNYKRYSKDELGQIIRTSSNEPLLELNGGRTLEHAELSPRCTPHIDSWDDYFIILSRLTALKSRDPSTQVGAVIVSPDKTIQSLGYNDFPRGVYNGVKRYEDRSEKYPRTVHAELNAILNAGRNGVPLKDSILYVTHPTCVDCSRAIIQAGISRVVVDDRGADLLEREPWKSGWRFAREMYDESGVLYSFLSLDLVLKMTVRQ